MSTDMNGRFVPLPQGRGRYRDAAGADREVCIDVDRGGRLRIIDMGAEETYLVERLGGFDEVTQRTALKVATEYRAEIDAFLDGSRASMPNPHPLGAAPIKLAEYAPKTPPAQTPRPAPDSAPRRRRQRKPPVGQESIELSLLAA
jgi:hypothetical protein